MKSFEQLAKSAYEAYCKKFTKRIPHLPAEFLLPSWKDVSVDDKDA
jgi:hypothetical protein